MNHDFDVARHQMVMTQLEARGISDLRVLAAMRDLPRHEFVPPDQAHLAYTDQPLLIGEGQTISQPYIVALMTEMLALNDDDVVLEIGTGSGYQTAVLCCLVRRVYSVEYYPRLAQRAAALLKQLDIGNVEIRLGDGSLGMPDAAPFDAILATAAAPAVPGPLRSQLSVDGGRLIMPVGSRSDQYLNHVVRRGNTWSIQQGEPVRFVLMAGRYGFRLPTSSDSDAPGDA